MTAKKKKPAASRSKTPRAKAKVAKPSGPPAVIDTAMLEAPAPEVVTQAPEADLAARWTPAPALPARPTQRRIIFVDVENTSRAGDILKVLEHLTLDRVRIQTDLIASGNWRVIGSETSRLLAKHGAQLVHSAPATGVRDWSDLRIAVAAGLWLASARPGDSIDIVSDDRAFDVVGDVAATLGIRFTRISYRHLPASAPLVEPTRTADKQTSRGRGRSRRRRPSVEPQAPELAATELPSLPVEPPVSVPVPSQAPTSVASSSEDILALVRELLRRSTGGSVSIDAVARQLKRLGFERPAGAPRLVTRLRAFKEFDISPPGLIRLRDATGETSESPQPLESPSPETPSTTTRRPRRRRRGRSQRPEGTPRSEGAQRPADNH